MAIGTTQMMAQTGATLAYRGSRSPNRAAALSNDSRTEAPRDGYRPDARSAEWRPTPTASPSRTPQQFAAAAYRQSLATLPGSDLAAQVALSAASPAPQTNSPAQTGQPKAAQLSPDQIALLSKSSSKTTPEVWQFPHHDTSVHQESKQTSEDDGFFSQSHGLRLSTDGSIGFNIGHGLNLNMDGTLGFSV